MNVKEWRVYGAHMMAMALLATSAWQARAEADKVTLIKNRQVVAGKITKDDRDGLEIDTGQGKRTFGLPEIFDVEWDIADESFHEAMTAFRGNSYSRAADRAQDIVNSKEALDRVRPITRPYLYYIFAESKYRTGRAAEAMSGYQTLIEKFPNSRYVPYALSNMAEATIQAKAFDKLPALLKMLSEGGPEQKQMADYYEGEALLAQNKPADALRKYGAALGGNAPKARALALVGQARAYSASGEPARAREAAQSALALNPPENLGAIAHSIIGDATLADADAKKLAGSQLQDALLDAILEYMRVTQYAADTQTEGYALLKAGECFKRLSKLPTRSGSDDRERAIALFNRINSERKFASNQDLLNKVTRHLDEITK